MMLLHKYLLASCLGLFLIASIVRAEDPLRFLPANTASVAKIENPVALVTMLVRYATLPEAKALQSYKDLYSLPNYRKALQFLAYAEKKFGKAWPQLLDEVAGQGIVVGTAKKAESKAEEKSVFLIQGKNSKTMEAMVEFLIDLIKEEAVRQDIPPSFSVGQRDGHKLWKVNGAFHLLLHENTLLAGVADEFFEKAYANLKKPGKSILDEASFQSIASLKNGKDAPLGWFWIDLDHLRVTNKELQQNAFTLPTNDPIPHLLLGGWFNVAKSSSGVMVKLCDTAQGPQIQLAMPSGREAMTPVIREAFTSDATQKPRPLLVMDDLIYSSSFTFNVSTFWTKRSEFVSPNVVKEWEEGNNKSSQGLFGKKISDFVTELGSRHRFIIARNEETSYQMKSKIAQPAYAVILETKDDSKFAKMIEPPLRTAGFLASAVVGMKQIEETYKGAKIIGYRFHETEKNRLYADGTLFNYTPCFAKVGNQFVAASTQSLCKKVIDAIEAESKVEQKSEAYLESTHWMSWSGLSTLAYSNYDELITRSILHFGGDEQIAKDEITKGAALLDRLGKVEAKVIYEPTTFRIVFQSRLKK